MRTRLEKKIIDIYNSINHVDNEIIKLQAELPQISHEYEESIKKLTSFRGSEKHNLYIESFKLKNRLTSHESLIMDLTNLRLHYTELVTEMHLQ